MTTLLYTHGAFARHETPPGHPERADRVRAVEAALGAAAFGTLERRAAPAASDAMIELVHPRRFREALEDIEPGEGFVRLDPDTYLGRSSLDASRRAAGAACAGVEAIYAGEASNAFVAARPPGHHAEPERAMGFCFFNGAAIAAMHARAAHGANRVAVVDFDVHHGNGVEAAFWHEEGAFYGSSHEFPQYPGTGRASDRGAFGNIVNVPLPTGTDGEGFRRAWGETLLPALADFSPDFIIISAGFDGHRADPVGGHYLTEADYAWVTAEILAVARQTAAGRVVSILEGGYDLAGLARSAAAHVAVLAGLQSPLLDQASETAS